MLQNILVGEGRRAKPAAMPARLGDRYLLEHAVSTSAVSVVWRAKDLEYDAPVALKLFPPEFVRAPADMSAARKILAATGQATHPGVVTAHDIVVAGKYAAFVSPWIEGPTLRQTMSALPSRFFEVDMFRQWLGGLLVALESAHQQGLVHGALDPDLVLQHGRDVYVVGFGINAWLRRAAVGHCRRAALDKASGYLSPAQSRGEVPRPDDDIFALGALIYEVLTGTPPQSGRWWQRRGLPVEMTRQRRRNGANGSDVIPETWERAIARCLEPLERDRIGSIRELRQRLEFDEDDQLEVAAAPPPRTAPSPRTATPAPPTRQTREPAQRRPFPAPLQPPLPRPADAATRESSPGDHADSAPAFGSFWSRALWTALVVVTITLAGGFVWKLSERQEAYRALLADVRAFPVDGDASERAALEMRLAAVRPELSTEQWSAVLTAWEQKETASPRETPAAPVPAVPGGIVVVSDPPGAEIRLPGRPPQRAPYAAVDLTPGEYPLEVSLAGFATYSTTVVVTADEISQVQVPLKRLHGTLQIEAEPAGIEFSVYSVSDEVTSLEGVTPAELELPTGRYIVEFRPEGITPRYLNVEVTAAEPAFARAAFPDPAERNVDAEELAGAPPRTAPLTPPEMVSVDSLPPVSTEAPKLELGDTSTVPSGEHPGVESTGHSEGGYSSPIAASDEQTEAALAAAPEVAGAEESGVPEKAEQDGPDDRPEVVSTDSREPASTEVPIFEPPLAMDEAEGGATSKAASEPVQSAPVDAPAVATVEEPEVPGETEEDAPDVQPDMVSTDGPEPATAGDTVVEGPPARDFVAEDAGLPEVTVTAPSGVVPVETPEPARAGTLVEAPAETPPNPPTEVPDLISEDEPGDASNVTVVIPVEPGPEAPAPPADSRSTETSPAEPEPTGPVAAADPIIVSVPETEPVATVPAVSMRDSRIFELKDVDTAPRLVGRVDPELPRWGRGRPARVELIIVIDRNGRVASASVHTTTRRALVEPVLRAVRQWQFTPAAKAGQTVPVRVSLPLSIPAS